MSHSILRVARVKGSSNTKGIQRHNQRKNENYNNKDINHEETYKNYDLINAESIDYKQVIDETIDANYVGKRAIRKDAIKHVDGLITSDKEFFDKLNDEETNQFFKDSLSFLEDEYGKKNMLYATVHLDEKVPHMHFGFVPLTDDGRLSAKEKIGNKKAMTELQDRFNSFVNSRGYELERGTSKEVTEKEHRDVDRFKKDTQYHQQEIEKVKTDLNELKEQFKTDLDRINSAGNFEYEDEMKGFLNKESTGRKIISVEEAERQQNTLASAERIIDDYESIKNTDLYQRNRLLRDNSIQLAEANKRLESKNKDLNAQLEEETEKRKEVESFSKDYNENVIGLYKSLRTHIPGFEKIYDKTKEKLLQNDLTHKSGQFMKAVQETVHLEDKKERNVSRKRQRDDLEL